MNNPRQSIVVFLIYAIAALPIPGIAQEAGPTNLPQVYQVEVILFRYTNPAQTSTEAIWAAAPIQETEMTSSSQLPLNESLQEPNGQRWWLPADPASERLGNVSQRLAASGAYKMLAHRTWLQLADGPGRAEWLPLADLDIAPDVAVGKLKFYQKEALYLAADVSLAGVDAPAGPTIAGTRKLPLTQVIYFDNPQFGLIATVTRSDVPWPNQ